MKVFIDLGMNDGEIMKTAMSKYPDFDKFIGFEPVPELYEKAKKLLEKEGRCFFLNLAVGASNSNEKLYLNYYSIDNSVGPGSTFIREKTTGKLKDDRFIMVDVIDFSEYLINNFDKDDYIILKIDIEGAEYDLLEHLIKTCSISYIDKIFCEWHYHKIAREDMNKDRHDKLVKKLNKIGINVTGNRKKDEFSRWIKKNMK